MHTIFSDSCEQRHFIGRGRVVKCKNNKQRCAVSLRSIEVVKLDGSRVGDTMFKTARWIADIYVNWSEGCWKKARLAFGIRAGDANVRDKLVNGLLPTTWSEGLAVREITVT